LGELLARSAGRLCRAEQPKQRRRCSRHRRGQETADSGHLLGDARNPRRDGGGNRHAGTDRGRTRPGAGHGVHSTHHGQQQIGGRAGGFVPLYARPAGHFAPAAFRGNASQPACPVRWDCRFRWRAVLAAAGAYLYILPLRGSGRLRQRRASRHGYSCTGGNTNPSCPQRHGAGQRLERQLRQSGAAG